MSAAEKIELEVSNEEITELTADEAASIQGGGFWGKLLSALAIGTGSFATSRTRR
jgi:hypothetical protein